MNKNERKKQIVESIQSFGQNSYAKADLLPEYLKLQDEVSTVIFGSGCKGKRFKDASSEMIRRCKEVDNESNDNLDRFIADSKFMTNEIRALISGERGEQDAFKSLDTLFSNHRILKNVELKDNNHKTEIDAIVLTPKCAFIVEVKNSKRNIVIDESGNYYKVSKSGPVLDQNIGYKMNDKAYLLKRALEKSGYYGVYIEQLVVFTNSLIKFTNNYRFIKTCSLASLPRIIDSKKGSKIYSDENLDSMCAAIEINRSDDKYNCPINIGDFKENFAELVASLEEKEEKKRNQKNMITSIFHRFKKHLVPVAVASCAIAFGISKT